jgi:WD40 repeat protein
MTSSKHQRHRGVKLTDSGWNKLQNRLQELQLGRNVATEIARRSHLADEQGLHPDTIRKILRSQTSVDENSLRVLFQVLELRLAVSDYYFAHASVPSIQPTTRQDLREAPELNRFYGRDRELSQLDHWILADQARLITLLGMGGIGKTALAVQWVQQLLKTSSEVENLPFQSVIWRSLRDAPPLQIILHELVQFLSQGKDLPSTTARISDVLRCFHQSRCLVILDNAESILQSGEYTGYYRSGYEGYGELLTRLGEETHQSCAIVTSREKPREIALLENGSGRVKTLQLQGLTVAASEALLAEYNSFETTADEWQAIIHYYNGNPLALKIAAAVVQDYFDGHVTALADYLQPGTILCSDLRNLLKQQCDRLTHLEHQIMDWLAVSREGMPLSELQQNLIQVSSPAILLDAVESLHRRSLLMVHRSGANTTFTLQPVVMEYVTKQLVERMYQEIISQADDKPSLRTIAILLNQSKDYIRETQKQFILTPILDRLRDYLGTNEKVIKHLIRQLTSFKSSTLNPGYAPGNLLNLLVHLKADLTGLDLSHLPFWQADFQRVSLHNVNLSGADLSRSTFVETLGEVFSLALSPDGTMLAIGESTGKIHLIGLQDGHRQHQLAGHSGCVWTVQFSPDGKLLASCGQDGIIQIWQVATDDRLLLSESGDRHLYTVAFSPDGRYLASGGNGLSVKLWDVNQGKLIQTLDGHQDWIISLAFSPVANHLFSSSNDGTIRCWDWTTGTCLQTFTGHTGKVWSVACSPDGRFIASGSTDQTVRLWSTETGECLEVFIGHRSSVWNLQFTPDNSCVISASMDQTLRVWDVERGECRDVLRGHQGVVFGVAISPDGEQIISGSQDQTIRLWSSYNGRCFKTLRGYKSAVWAIACSEDGNLLASGSSDACVRLWDLATGQCVQILRNHSALVYGAAFRPGSASNQDERLLATSSLDGTVQIWRSPFQHWQLFHEEGTQLYSLAFSANGQQLITANHHYAAKLWQVDTGQCLRPLEGHTGTIYAVAMHPTNDVAATGSEDATVKLWDTERGICHKTLSGHTNRVFSLAFSPNGDVLASASFDNTIRLWNVKTGECWHVLEEHTDWIFAVAFSPDGSVLASASSDRTVKLWDTTTGRCLKTLIGHSSRVLAIAFIPDGKTITSGSDDETIRLWDRETGQCIQILESTKPYEGLNIAGAIGLNQARRTILKSLGAIEVEG